MLPNLQQSADPFMLWLSAWKPTELTFTAFVFVILFTFIIVLWRKVLPFLIDVKWPADQALRVKRAEAEIALHSQEIEEARMMRSALEKLNTVASNLMLLVEQHDKGAVQRDEAMAALLRIVLEKLGVEPSQVTAILSKESGNQAMETVLKKLAENLQKGGETAKA